MSDRSQLAQQYSDAAFGIAACMEDSIKEVTKKADELYDQNLCAARMLNQAQVASRGEIENEPSLTGKVRHLIFIAESAEKAEIDLRNEVYELRCEIADLCDILAQTANRAAAA